MEGLEGCIDLACGRGRGSVAGRVWCARIAATMRVVWTLGYGREMAVWRMVGA